MPIGIILRRYKSRLDSDMRGPSTADYDKSYVRTGIAPPRAGGSSQSAGLHWCNNLVQIAMPALVSSSVNG